MASGALFHGHGHACAITNEIYIKFVLFMRANKSFDKVTQFRYFGTTVKKKKKKKKKGNLNYIQEENKSTLKSGNTCYQSGHYPDFPSP
jgi:hypothetical protein